MPFLLPLALLGGTGIFAYKAADTVGNTTAKLMKYAAIGGAAYVAFKVYKG